MWRRGCCHLLHLKICVVFASFPVHRLRQPCRAILNSLHGQRKENVEAGLLPSVALEDIHSFACFPVHRLRQPCRGILNSLHGQREENVKARLLPSVALEDMHSFCFLSSAQIAATVQGEFSTVSMGNGKSMWRRGCCHLLHLKICVVFAFFPVHRLRQPCRGILKQSPWATRRECGGRSCCHLLHLKITIVLLAFQCTDCGNRAGEFSTVSMGNGKRMWRRGCCHLLHLKISIVLLAFQCTDCGNRAGEFSTVSMGNGKRM